MPRYTPILALSTRESLSLLPFLERRAPSRSSCQMWPHLEDDCPNDTPQEQKIHCLPLSPWNSSTQSLDDSLRQYYPIEGSRNVKSRISAPTEGALSLWPPSHEKYCPLSPSSASASILGGKGGTGLVVTIVRGLGSPYEDDVSVLVHYIGLILETYATAPLGSATLQKFFNIRYF